MKLRYLSRADLPRMIIERNILWKIIIDTKDPFVV